MSVLLYVALSVLYVLVGIAMYAVINRHLGRHPGNWFLAAMWPTYLCVTLCLLPITYGLMWSWGKVYRLFDDRMY